MNNTKSEAWRRLEPNAPGAGRPGGVVPVSERHRDGDGPGYVCECGRDLVDMWLIPADGLMVDCPTHGPHEWGSLPLNKAAIPLRRLNRQDSHQKQRDVERWRSLRVRTWSQHRNAPVPEGANVNRVIIHISPRLEGVSP